MSMVIDVAGMVAMPDIISNSAEYSRVRNWRGGRVRKQRRMFRQCQPCGAEGSCARDGCVHVAACMVSSKTK